MAVDYQRLERTLTREFRQYHVVAQIRRVVLVFLAALALQLKDGWHDWTWKGVYALGLAAAYGTALKLAPQVPWKMVLGHVKLAQVVAAQKDAQTGAQQAPSEPTAEQVYTPVSTPATPAAVVEGDVPPGSAAGAAAS